MIWFIDIQRSLWMHTEMCFQRFPQDGATKFLSNVSLAPKYQREFDLIEARVPCDHLFEILSRSSGMGQ
jgi:hypothetical protein